MRTCRPLESPPPEPLADRTYSGRFVVRVPPETHRDLVIKTAEEGGEPQPARERPPRGMTRERGAAAMTTTARSTKLTAAVETYFAELGRLSGSGGATEERSTYGPLAKLLDAVGATLKPKVFCVAEPVNHGAGHPDFGLYTSKQVQKGQPRKGQLPERGVVEVKSLQWDTRATMVREQVSRYWGRYRLVLVTNLREFDLVGPDAKGGERTLESYRLADSGTEFARRLERPRTFARETGAGLGEYLSRALSHRAALTEPKDLAWLLASYARDGLARVETTDDSPALAAVRSALEEALGVRFEGEKGARFFHSTLVQTLFYGVFSAWVLWARQSSTPASTFDWRTAVWHLRAPVLPSTVPAAFRPGPPGATRTRRGAGLDGCRARPSGPARLLRPLQRG